MEAGHAIIAQTTASSLQFEDGQTDHQDPVTDPSTSRRIAAARLLSLVGHPALLVPSAVVCSVAGAGRETPGLWLAGVAAVSLAACVVAYSLLKVRRGRWRDADASLPAERAQLTAFLFPLMAAGALAMGLLGLPVAAVAGLGFGAVMVAVAHATGPRMKLSLHAAFAVYAAALLWSWPAVVAACLLLAAGVAWSRVVLGRHTVLEARLGLALGAAGGMALHAVAAAAPH